MSFAHLQELALASGGVLYLMPLLMLLVLTIGIERGWHLARLLAIGRGVIARIGALENLDASMLKKEIARLGNQPAARVLYVPLQFPDVDDHDRLRALLDEAVMREVPAIDRSLWMLDTIVTLAPLLGLLGTIIGMFNAFAVLGDISNGAAQITGGIAEALIATASGLLVAIVGLVLFNALQTRVRLEIHDLETLEIMLVNRLNRPQRDAPEGLAVRRIELVQ